MKLSFYCINKLTTSMALFDILIAQSLLLHQ